MCSLQNRSMIILKEIPEWNDSQEWAIYKQHLPCSKQGLQTKYDWQRTKDGLNQTNISDPDSLVHNQFSFSGYFDLVKEVYYII